MTRKQYQMHLIESRFAFLGGAYLAAVEEIRNCSESLLCSPFYAAFLVSALYSSKSSNPSLEDRAYMEVLSEICMFYLQHYHLD